ncbi:carbonic anhydrase [Sansalvadorimonas sp. 2012CJ34-2]|uniref:Carbonic anhydrase n=1 Tax=Parendozoicomonas callyspongiae TaxID=2942213 RepID=A0ABT0PH43_9GAMM|nr:carbonic anhydrase [Sansalvadorimonas sp. 2012CJ34-2]MCL6270326.1 carbonic anhydrase [Sansalvadorimonas sp. 2012CJ34-2]
MDEINRLVKQNRKWAENKEEEHPGFFTDTARKQSPEYLWIGCCDSRMPAEMVTGMEPGDMLVYRNVANLVTTRDTSCMAAIQFAVDALHVKHIIVTGHTNCGGIQAGYSNNASGELEEWLKPVRDLCDCHKDQIENIPDDQGRVNRLVELNIEQQVLNLADLPVIQNAWKRGQQLTIHGCLYDLATGELNPLGIMVNSLD